MSKKLAGIFGVVFVLVGFLGFFSNPIVGAVGYFETDLVHNLVHLLIGVVLLLVVATAPGKSNLWLKIVGALYLVLALFGFLSITDSGTLFGLVRMNNADNYLHLLLGVIIFGAGFMSSDEHEMPQSMPMSGAGMM